MTLTLRCLDCGFHFVVTLLRGDNPDVASPVSCGHCRCNRWKTTRTA